MSGARRVTLKEWRGGEYRLVLNTLGTSQLYVVWWDEKGGVKDPKNYNRLAHIWTSSSGLIWDRKHRDFFPEEVWKYVEEYLDELVLLAQLRKEE